MPFQAAAEVVEAAGLVLLHVRYVVNLVQTILAISVFHGGAAAHEEYARRADELECGR
jgi:hypothetical protein